MRPAPAASLTAAMGGTLPSSASKIAGQSRFVPPDRLACVPRSRQFSAACPLHAGILLRKTAPASGRGLPARCMRAFCFAKPQNPLFSKNRRGRICRTSIRRKCRFARLWQPAPALSHSWKEGQRRGGKWLCAPLRECEKCTRGPCWGRGCGRAEHRRHSARLYTISCCVLTDSHTTNIVFTMAHT